MPSGNKLRLLIDATIMRPQGTGISRYVRAMIPALGSQPGVELVVAGNDEEALSPGYLSDRPFETVLVSRRTRQFVERQLWRERNLPRIVAEFGIDVVLIPAPEMTYRRQMVPTITVVHDVGPMARPDLYPRGKRIRFRLLPRTMMRASAIVCVSESTAAELAPILRPGHPPVTVIGEGTGFLSRQAAAADPAPRSPPATVAPPKVPSRSAPALVLYTGTDFPHKNLATLVKAFEPIDDARLVLIGPGTERFSGSPNVDARGWVEDRVLKDALARADIVVNASLYEGFGMPALEALTAGLPAVLSAIPAFVEVAGSAAEFVAEPESPAAWTATISGLLHDPARRAELASAGLRRAERWSWDGAAAQMRELLVQLVAEAELAGSRQPRPAP